MYMQIVHFFLKLYLVATVINKQDENPFKKK